MSACVYFHSPGAAVLGRETQGVSPKGSGCGRDVPSCPGWLCPRSSHPSATLEECAHLSGDSDTVVMAGGFVFPKKKLAHHWPGSDLGSPGGTAQVSAPQAALPPPRSHPRRFAQLHASPKHPKQISKRGMFFAETFRGCSSPRPTEPAATMHVPGWCGMTSP